MVLIQHAHLSVQQNCTGKIRLNLPDHALNKQQIYIPYSTNIGNLHWSSRNQIQYRLKSNLRLQCPNIFSCPGSSMYTRARWEYQYHNFHLAHMYSYVKLNSKASLFSCIFWFWDSLLCKIALLWLLVFAARFLNLAAHKNHQMKPQQDHLRWM